MDITATAFHRSADREDTFKMAGFEFLHGTFHTMVLDPAFDDEHICIHGVVTAKKGCIFQISPNPEATVSVTPASQPRHVRPQLSRRSIIRSSINHLSKVTVSPYSISSTVPPFKNQNQYVCRKSPTSDLWSNNILKSSTLQVQFLRRREMWLGTSPHNPIQDLSRAPCLCIPS
jgi:hypothetical protein